MKRLLPALAPVLLSILCHSAWADETNSVEMLNANIYNSCAPWDGAALDIVVETIDVTIHLYNEDIANLKSGKVINVSISQDNMASTAVVKDPSSGLGWKPVTATIKINLKKLKGYVTVNGSAHPLTIHWNMNERVFCG